jgi:hypothetical protein
MVHGGDTPDTIYEKTAGRQLTSGRRIKSLNGNNAMSNRRSGVSGERPIDNNTIADFRHRTSMGNQTANHVATGPSRNVDQIVPKHPEDAFRGITAFLPKSIPNSSDPSRLRTQNTAQKLNNWANQQSNRWSEEYPQKYNFDKKPQLRSQMIAAPSSSYLPRDPVSSKNSQHFSSSSRSGPSSSLSMFKNGTQA